MDFPINRLSQVQKHVGRITKSLYQYWFLCLVDELWKVQKKVRIITETLHQPPLLSIFLRSYTNGGILRWKRGFKLHNLTWKIFFSVLCKSKFSGVKLEIINRITDMTSTICTNKNYISLPIFHFIKFHYLPFNEG